MYFFPKYVAFMQTSTLHLYKPYILLDLELCSTLSVNLLFSYYQAIWEISRKLATSFSEILYMWKTSEMYNENDFGIPLKMLY